MDRQFEARPQENIEPRKYNQPTELLIDCERYQNLLDTQRLDEEDRIAFLQSLWSVMTAFIDLGYGVSPAQLAQDSGSILALCESEFSTSTKIAA
jgi:hypothetical protein